MNHTDILTDWDHILVRKMHHYQTLQAGHHYSFPIRLLQNILVRIQSDIPGKFSYQ